QKMGGMMLGYEPNLARRRTPCIDDKMRLNQRLGRERAHQRAAGVIFSHNTEEDTARAKCRDVARNVASAAHREFVALDCENRSRRVGRDARDLAVDEIVEHQIANADDGLLGNQLERVLEIEHAAIAWMIAGAARFTDTGPAGSGTR